MSRVDIAVMLRLIDQLTGPIQKSKNSLVEFNRTLTQLGKTATATTKTLSQLATASAKLTATLSESAGSMKAIGTSATTAARSLTKMATATNGLASEAGKVQNSFVATFDRINIGTTGAIASTRALATEWRQVATSAATASSAVKAAGAMSATATAAARAAAGGGRGGHGGTYLSMRGPGGTHFGGGFSAHSGSLVGQGLLAALGYGVEEQAKLEDFAYRGVFTAGLPNGQAETYARMRQLQTAIAQAASRTGASITDLGESTLTELRMMQGFTWKQKLALLPSILQFGAAEARLKGVSVNEGTQVAIGLAHMFGQYTPQGIADLGNRFGFLSTMTPSSPTQLERALGYSVPVLRSYGYDPWRTAMLTAMMQRAGILNTKSGTWLRNMAQLALPGTTAQSKQAFKLHEAALQKVGLVDAKGALTFLTNGLPDIVKLLTIAGAAIEKMKPIERAGVEKQLFGQQGSGALAVLSDPQLLALLKPTATAMSNFKSGSDFFQQYAQNSPVQTLNQSWADFRGVLMDTATVVLPALTGALRGFDDMLKEIQKFLPGGGSGDFAKTVGHAYGRGLASGNPVEAIGSGVWAAAKYWWAGNSDQEKAPPEHSASVDALKRLPQTASAKSVGTTLLDDLKAALDYLNPITAAHAAERDNRGIAKLAMPAGTIMPSLMVAPVPYLDMGDQAANAGRKSSASFATTFLDMVVPSIRSADVPIPDGTAGAGAAAGKTWSDSFMGQMRTIISTAKLEGPSVKKPASAPAPSAGQQPITHVHVGSVTIHVDGVNDPKQTADAVEDCFHRATWRGLWDGQFSEIST